MKRKPGVPVILAVAAAVVALIVLVAFLLAQGISGRPAEGSGAASASASPASEPIGGSLPGGESAVSQPAGSGLPVASSSAAAGASSRQGAASVYPEDFDAADFLAYLNRLGMYVEGPYNGLADFRNPERQWGFVVLISEVAFEHETARGTVFEKNESGEWMLPLPVAENYSTQMFGYKYDFTADTMFVNTEQQAIATGLGYGMEVYMEIDKASLAVSEANVITVRASRYHSNPGGEPKLLGSYTYTFEYLPHNDVPYQLVEAT